jgi:hypothetical protein
VITCTSIINLSNAPCGQTDSCAGGALGFVPDLPQGESRGFGRVTCTGTRWKKKIIIICFSVTRFNNSIFQFFVSPQVLYYQPLQCWWRARIRAGFATR